jgi:hypothetical protein
MDKNIIKKYKVKYAVAALFILLIIPAVFYVFFAYHGMLHTWPLFHSVGTWCAAAVLSWLIGVYFMLMVANWNTKMDQTFQTITRGFTAVQRVKNVWALALLPPIIGCLFANYTFLEQPDPGEEYSKVRLLILLIGFIPITIYSIARAKQITEDIIDEKIMNFHEKSPDFYWEKFSLLAVMIFTFATTPFFGAVFAGVTVRHFIPRRGGLYFIIIVLSGFLITEIILPQAKILGRIKQGDLLALQAGAIYSTVALFTGVAYILLIKLASHFKRRKE